MTNEQVLEEFDSLTEDSACLDSPVCCEQHDCLCSKISNRESIKSFISKKLDEQREEIRKTIAGLEDKCACWSGEATIREILNLLK